MADEKEIAELKKELEEKDEVIRGLTASLRRNMAELAKAQTDYAAVTNAHTWKMTAPIRKAFRAIKKKKIIYYPFKAAAILFTQGPAEMFRRTKKKIHTRRIADTYKISKAVRAQAENAVFEYSPLISVIVPLYNTPEKFLKAMIASVQAQTYKNWELCLADGSDALHPDVEKTVSALAAADSRIKYVRLEKNEGISDNTNRAIEISRGDYIALFDHDDILHPLALTRVVKAINEENADFIYTDEATFYGNNPSHVVTAHFKPDFSPDTLRSYNYICHLTVLSRKLIDKVGLFRKKCDGSQDYDMILRASEAAENIVHIPEILYYWRGHKNSTAEDLSSKPYIIEAAHRALTDHLARLNLPGEVLDARFMSAYRISYDIIGQPLISIIIPNKDNIDSLDKCVSSIFEKSSYRNFEIIIAENNSTDDATFDYYRALQAQYKNLKVVFWQGTGFNYPAINNFGAKNAAGEYYLLLNNDVEVISENWLEEMLMLAQRRDVGAVGAMLYYPDDTIQHAGVIVGIGGVAGHAHKCFPRGDLGYMGRAAIVENFSAVTFACAMIPAKVYWEVNGIDEKFAVAFNDVDMCLRIKQAGYNICFTPYAELYHYESKSRGMENTPEKVKRFEGEVTLFKTRWADFLEKGDPCYNKNLTLSYEDFSIKFTK